MIPMPPRRAAIALLACLFGAVGAAQAQTAAPNPGFTPQVGQAGKDVIWVPTPDGLVDRMLRMAQVTANDFVVDLGSGDGKIVIAAARNFGARALGVEYNPDMVTLSRRNAERAGVTERARFEQGDIFKFDFTAADVVTMYLLPTLNLQLRPTLLQMRPGTRLTSHQFTMGDWEPDETSTVDSRPGYLWIVPANAGGNWKMQWRDAAGAGEADVEIDQTFQKIKGTVRFAQLQTTLREPALRGERIRFELMDERGVLRRFEGRLAGGRMEGTVTGPGGASGTFSATRPNPPPPIRTGSGSGDWRSASDAAFIVNTR